ncbi:MAG: choice-of-anchor Q domain-containing protein, partial [Bdellovibrio sp.]
ILRNNYVTNLNSVNYSLNHTDFFQTWGFAGSSTYNILVEGNVVTNSTAQLGNTSNDGYSALHDITFRNNIFANIGAAFFTGVPNTKFYNNVFYNCGIAQGYAVSYYNATYYNSAGSEFKNNVFLNNIRDINNHDGITNVTISNNYFGGANYTPKSNTVDMGSNFVNGGDVKFMDVTGLNFHIQSGSVLIDKGVDLSSSFTTDKDGNTRSGAWDIGAYEFTSVVTPPISLASPKNLRVLSSVAQ